VKVAEGFEYASDNNREWMSVEQRCARGSTANRQDRSI
jgi:hypothetical protein